MSAKTKMTEPLARQDAWQDYLDECRMLDEGCPWGDPPQPPAAMSPAPPTSLRRRGTRLIRRTASSTAMNLVVDLLVAGLKWLVDLLL